MMHYLVIDEANDFVFVSADYKLFSDLAEYSVEQGSKLVIYKIDISNQKLTRVRIYEELKDDRT